MKRRQVLMGGAAIGIASLAGCSDVLGGGGSTGNLGNVAQWLPEPADITDDQDHYGISARSPSRLANLFDNPVLRSEFAPSLDYANPRATDVEYTVSASAGGRNFDVNVGQFNVDWVEHQMDTAEDLDRDSDIGDFAVFLRENNNGVSDAYAISNRAYIHTSDTGGFDEPADALDVLTTVIETREGDIGRYHEQNQDMEILVDDLSFGHMLNARTMDATDQSEPEIGEFENVVARGSTRIIQGETTDTEEIIVFENERDISEREIETYIEESSSFDGYRQRPGYDIADRSVIIEGTQQGVQLFTSGSP